MSFLTRLAAHRSLVVTHTGSGGVMPVFARTLCEHERALLAASAHGTSPILAHQKADVLRFAERLARKEAASGTTRVILAQNMRGLEAVPLESAVLAGVLCPNVVSVFMDPQRSASARADPLGALHKGLCGAGLMPRSSCTSVEAMSDALVEQNVALALFVRNAPALYHRVAWGQMHRLSRAQVPTLLYLADPANRIAGMVHGAGHYAYMHAPLSTTRVLIVDGGDVTGKSC